MLHAWAHSECLRVGVRLCAQCLELPLCLCSLSWQGSVQLGDLAVDERTQRFFQLVEVPLQLPVVLLLILANQSLILPQGILTPAWQKQQESAQPFGSSFFFFFYELRVSHRVCHHLLVKSLKQRRSLLWWRNSFGSSGMSERKTCATSRGPCEGEKKPVIYLLRNVYLCLNTIPDLAAQIGWDSYSRGRFTTASGVLVTEIGWIYINKPWCPIWILASICFFPLCVCICF